MPASSLTRVQSDVKVHYSISALIFNHWSNRLIHGWWRSNSPHHGADYHFSSEKLTWLRNVLNAAAHFWLNGGISYISEHGFFFLEFPCRNFSIFYPNRNFTASISWEEEKKKILKKSFIYFFFCFHFVIIAIFPPFKSATVTFQKRKI